VATPIASTDLGRRERRKIELRSRILDAAKHLFVQQGFAQSKVAEICDRADVAQKTFFNYFPSKQDVLREIARVALADTVAQIESVRKEPGTATQKLGAFYEQVCDQADEAGPMHREMLTEILHVAHETAQPEAARRLQAAFGALLEDGAAAGEFAPNLDLHASTELVLGSYYALMFSLAHQPNYPLRDRARAQVSLLARLLTATAPAPSKNA